MKIFKNKKFITYIGIIIAVIFCLLFMTGCNKQIIDLDYTYDKAICNYSGTTFVLKIDKWKDYDGEQLQIKSGEKTYLLSANNCYLVDE